MKRPVLSSILLSLVGSVLAIASERATNTIILSELGAKNLNIETAEATERNFEKTFFAIGRIESRPEARSRLSSRIAGRIVQLNAFTGDLVKKGDTLLRVESRQPGSPPPVIPMTSPRDGIILESHVTDGEPVEPEKELLDIVDLTRVWAVAKIPESEAGSLKIGTKARVKVRAAGDKTIEGKLLRFGARADRNSTTIDAIFELENADFTIRPGMRAEFSIITSSREDILSIPRTAIQGDPTNRVVFVKDFDLDNAFIKSPVHLGAKNDLYAEVLGGLFPGDEVVTNGSYALSFAGSGGGPSLKEALDAAHGHEHNEDGSEITDEQKSAKDDHEGHDHEENHSAEDHLNKPILIWAITSTLLLLVCFQAIIRKRKSNTNSNA